MELYFSQPIRAVSLICIKISAVLAQTPSMLTFQKKQKTKKLTQLGDHMRPNGFAEN